MKLKHLKEPWSELNRREKLSIIETSNERRVEAFEKRKSKGRKSKKKSKKKKSSKRKKRTPSTPEELMELKKKMSKEEWENFKMMVGTGQL